MEDNNVFSAKTVDDAIKLGLDTLGLTFDEIDYEVIEEGRKKLFGSVKAVVKIIPKGGKKPAVKATSKTEKAEKTEKIEKTEKTEKSVEKKSAKPAAKTAAKPAEKHREKRESNSNAVDPVTFVDGLLEFLGVEGKSEINADGTVIDIKTESSARVIGKHGDILDAIQCLAGAVANIGKEEYIKLVVDCENYRAQREQTLKDLAAKIAAKAVETGRKIVLEPMTPYERRVIHAALSENTEVKTASEGREPVRFVVVIPHNARPGDRGIRYGERRREGNNRFGDRRGRDRRDNDRRDRRRDGGQRSSGGAKRGKKEIHFGTFLGNSNDSKEEE